MSRRPNGALWLALGVFGCVFVLVVLGLVRTLPGPLLA